MEFAIPRGAKDAANPQGSPGSAPSRLGRGIKLIQVFDWYREASYLHFDRPIRDPDFVAHRVESPEDVARHSFLPFLHFEQRRHKFKLDIDGKGKFVPKVRPISYASHFDACVFRHYMNLLAPMYESTLEKADLTESVIAYRRFSPPQSNIDFAHSAFEKIASMRNCIVLAFDVRDFFEGLNHDLLKSDWCRLLGCSRLPADHWAVYRAVTSYAFVNRDDVMSKFGITKKHLKSWKGPLCTVEQFRSHLRGCELVYSNKRKCGVPQGSAMSGLLSNVYMLDVDRAMTAFCNECGGFYRRYSDDILVVAPAAHQADEATELLRRLMSARRLDLHDGAGKTLRAECTEAVGGTLCASKPIHYLGFSFNGSQIRIKHHTICRFLRRMKEAVRKEKWRATKLASETGRAVQIRKRRIFENYSHLGRRNFITYARKAQKIMKSETIRRQISRCWRDLNDEFAA
jgi:RNA-directed DNA polymerase